MAERIVESENSQTRTLTVEQTDGAESEEVRTVKVTLKKQKTDKQVKWTSETVDNEHMNKKKSKCCCIYEKPRNFGESSSEDEGECENCFGHVELKKKNKPTQPEPSSEEPSPDPPETPSPS